MIVGTTPKLRRDVLWAAGCAVISVLCVLVSWPFAEIGPADDWSYTYTVKVLAETGRWSYNGWASAMIGVQAYWAAAVVRVFGFSFAAVRLSNLPFVAGAAAMLFLFCRRARLPVHLALLGTACVVLSPAYLPVAASFLTDVPAFFFVLISIYAFAVAGETPGRISPAVTSLLIGAIAAWIGGTVRQTVWLVPLSILPTLAFTWRSRLRLATIAAALWIISLIVVWQGYLWIDAQPYSTSESPVTSLLAPFQSDASGAVFQIARLIAGAIALTLPVLAVLAPRLAQLRRRVILGAEFSIVATVLAVIYLRGSNGLLPSPLLGNQFTRWGVLEQNIGILGKAPAVLPSWLGVGYLTLVLFAAWAVGAHVVSHIREILRARPTRSIETSATATAAPMPAAIKLLLIYIIPYAAALLPRAVTGSAFDRYLFPVMATAALVSIHAFSQITAPRARRIGLSLAWALVTIGGAVGIATTHDYYALARAQVAATRQLTDAGISRSQITAGLAYDGWTQLELTGHVNERRVRNPSDAYRPLPHRVTDANWAYWFWPWVPDVKPTYYISRSPLRGIAPTNFPPVPYTTWLPWGRREVITGQGAAPAPVTSHSG